MSLSPETKQWLDANCPDGLRGKTVVITGANSGIGYKTAETAVYCGAGVILACRNPDRAEEARLALIREYPRASVTVMKLDLADFSSIDAFADEIRSGRMDIDVFVNNAGVFRHPGKKTADGFDLVIGTNYIGVYRLTEKLLPYLRTLPHEVALINTVSVIHKVARRIRYDDFCPEKRHRSLSVYARSKLCLAKYTYALAMRCRGTNIRVVMNHPGIAITPLGLNAFGEWVTRLAGVFGRMFNSPEKSSLSVAYIMGRGIPAGAIAGPHKVFDCWGYPRENRVLRRVKTGADELIRLTEEEIARAEQRKK